MSSILKKVGVVLILLSGVFFFAMLAVPWAPLTGGQKGLLAGGLLIGVEVSWWVGAAMVGPAAIQGMKNWFRQKKSG